MLILAFDTTSEHGGAAIYRDAECLASAENSGRSDYAVVLFQMVEKILEQARAKLSDVDVFAVANGPGSFTGIRVGVAAAQGWATAFGKPVCGVSVLGAMAEEAQSAADWVVPVLDAHRGEFYATLLGRTNSGAAARHGYRENGERWVMKPEQIAAMLREKIPAGRSVSCLARDHEPSAGNLRVALPESVGFQSVTGSLLGAIARIALGAHTVGRLQSPAELDALYIRRPDAEANWKG